MTWMSTAVLCLHAVSPGQQSFPKSSAPLGPHPTPTPGGPDRNHSSGWINTSRQTSMSPSFSDLPHDLHRRAVRCMRDMPIKVQRGDTHKQSGRTLHPLERSDLVNTEEPEGGRLCLLPCPDFSPREEVLAPSPQFFK